MSFRKPCHMPFRKLIPPFTLTAMILGSVFLDAAVIRHDRTNLRNQCVFRFNKEASINGVSCPVSMRSKLQRSVARDKSYC